MKVICRSGSFMLYCVRTWQPLILAWGDTQMISWNGFDLIGICMLVGWGGGFSWGGFWQTSCLLLHCGDESLSIRHCLGSQFTIPKNGTREADCMRCGGEAMIHDKPSTPLWHYWMFLFFPSSHGHGHHWHLLTIAVPFLSRSSLSRWFQMTDRTLRHVHVFTEMILLICKCKVTKSGNYN